MFTTISTNLLDLHKVKFSLYRAWRPLGLREVEAPIFTDIQLTDGGKAVSPTRQLLFYPQQNSWYSFLLKAESTPGPQVNRKNPPHPGLEPAAFQLVA
jgi:hypothetical protein